MIWGVGYGAITQLIKETGNLVKNGVPNIDTYGDFLPLSGWTTESGVLRLNVPCYFDTAINKGSYTQMIFSNVKNGSRGGYLGIGTTLSSHDLYYQVLSTQTTYAEIKIDLSDLPETFYLTFGQAAASASSKFVVGNVTLI